MIIISFDRPEFWLFLGCCVTSAIPLYDGVTSLVDYRPRVGESVSYETDPRFLLSLVSVYKSSLIFVVFGLFLVVKYLRTSIATLNMKLEKAEKNRMATQKQAEAASKQTLAMLDELNSLKTSENVKDNEKLNRQILMQKLEEAELKSKIIQENYVKLVEEYSLLEEKKEVATAKATGKKKESKKDK